MTSLKFLLAQGAATLTLQRTSEYTEGHRLFKRTGGGGGGGEREKHYLRVLKTGYLCQLSIANVPSHKPCLFKKIHYFPPVKVLARSLLQPVVHSSTCVCQIRSFQDQSVTYSL